MWTRFVGALTGKCSLVVIAFGLGACSGGGAPTTPPTGTNPPVSTAPPTNPPPTANADLAQLDISIGELDQIFQPGQTSYTANVGYLRNAVQLNLKTSEPAATVRVNGQDVAGNASPAIDLAEGQNAIQITVENGATQKKYSLAVTRDPYSSFGQHAYVKAPSAGVNDVFGTSLGLSADTLVVGAPYEDSAATGINGDHEDDTAEDSGAAFVFARDAAGNWNRKAYLKASNPDTNDNFGYSVAISGNLIAIGSRQESSNATGIDGDETNDAAFAAGAVYIFARGANGEWTQEAYIKPSNTIAGGSFGSAVALDGDTLVVAAQHMPRLIGSAYVFRRNASGAWTQESIITASDAHEDAGFAQSLALDGNTLAVGAPRHGGIFNPKGGVVYLYVRDSAGWRERAILKGSNTELTDEFGSSVALSGDTLAVGAPGESSSATGIGGNANDNSARESGAAYVFGRSAAGTWSQRAYVKPSNTGAQDLFGYAVALSGDWLAVTAPNEASSATGLNGNAADNSTPGSGAAYLFVRNTAGTWAQQLYVKAAHHDMTDQFGRSAAALSETNLIISAPFEDSNAEGVNGDATDDSASASGALYVFQ